MLLASGRARIPVAKSQQGVLRYDALRTQELASVSRLAPTSHLPLGDILCLPRLRASLYTRVSLVPKTSASDNCFR